MSDSSSASQVIRSRRTDSSRPAAPGGPVPRGRPGAPREGRRCRSGARRPGGRRTPGWPPRRDPARRRRSAARPPPRPRHRSRRAAPGCGSRGWRRPCRGPGRQRAAPQVDPANHGSSLGARDPAPGPAPGGRTLGHPAVEVGRRRRHARCGKVPGTDLCRGRSGVALPGSVTGTCQRRRYGVSSPPAASPRPGEQYPARPARLPLLRRRPGLQQRRRRRRRPSTGSSEVFEERGAALRAHPRQRRQRRRQLGGHRGARPRHPHVVALNLLRNYGQHNANLAGLREATGDYVITMDDDLQNPPDQALLLIDKAMKGHDVVFGRFERKQAPGYRRLGSKLIGLLNRRIFAQPPGPHRLQLPDPAPRRRRPDLRVAHRPPLHHRSGADVLQQPRRRPGPPRRRGRSATSNYGLTRILRAGAHDPVQLLAVPAARGCAGRLRRGARQLPARRLLPGPVASSSTTTVPGLDDDRRAALALQRRRHHAAVDAGRVRRPHAQRGQRASSTYHVSERVSS